MTHVKPLYRLRYQAMQVALLVAFLATLAIMHERRTQLAAHEKRMGDLDQLLGDVTYSRGQAQELLVKAKWTLETAEKQKAGKSATQPPPGPL